MTWIQVDPEDLNAAAAEAQAIGYAFSETAGQISATLNSTAAASGDGSLEASLGALQERWQSHGAHLHDRLTTLSSLLEQASQVYVTVDSDAASRLSSQRPV
jgi:Proteins of 100 residues with WXG